MSDRLSPEREEQIRRMVWSGSEGELLTELDAVRHERDAAIGEVRRLHREVLKPANEQTDQLRRERDEALICLTVHDNETRLRAQSVLGWTDEEFAENHLRIVRSAYDRLKE